MERLSEDVFSVMCVGRGLGVTFVVVTLRISLDKVTACICTVHRRLFSFVCVEVLGHFLSSRLVDMSFGPPGRLGELRQ